MPHHDRYVSRAIKATKAFNNVIKMVSFYTFATMSCNNILGSHSCNQDGTSTGLFRSVGQGTGLKPPPPGGGGEAPKAARAGDFD
jgi:hypothetical protein